MFFIMTWSPLQQVKSSDPYPRLQIRTDGLAKIFAEYPATLPSESRNSLDCWKFCSLIIFLSWLFVGTALFFQEEAMITAHL